MKTDVIIDKWLDELCPGDREHFEERAAIMHHCGGLPKEKADALARAEIESYSTHREKVDSGKVHK